MTRLLWTLAVSGAVIALGTVLVLRWLGAAGLPVTLRGRAPTSARVEVDRRECGAAEAGDVKKTCGIVLLDW